MPKADVDQLHESIQEDAPLKTTIVNDTNEPIKVFTDVPDALSTLTDARFQIASEPDDAAIFWLVGPGRNEYKAKALEKQGYLNEFPGDETLLVKDLFIPLLHSSYKCFSKESSDDSQ